MIEAERKHARARILQLGAAEVIAGEMPTGSELLECSDAIRESIELRNEGYKLMAEATKEGKVNNAHP